MLCTKEIKRRRKKRVENWGKKYLRRATSGWEALWFSQFCQRHVFANGLGLRRFALATNMGVYKLQKPQKNRHGTCL
jgi:hypothetical protein